MAMSSTSGSRKSLGADPELGILLVQRAASLDPADNRSALADIAARVDPARHRLVVLPEASARDFGKPGSDLGPFAEPLDGPFAQALREAASSTGVTWLAGMFETSADPGRPFNTLLLTGPDGEHVYRKIHLYDSFGFEESGQVSPGPTTPVVTEVDGVPVGLMTCYDLRFPELARALAVQGAEVLVVPAAWVAGERKVHHWRTLLQARAIENTVWVVAAAQPGPRYTGHSMVVSPAGDVVGEAGEEAAELTAVVDRASVADVRRTNPSLANRRL